jgi:hypothetical protein
MIVALIERVNENNYHFWELMLITHFAESRCPH